MSVESLRTSQILKQLGILDTAIDIGSRQAKNTIEPDFGPTSATEATDEATQTTSATEGADEVTRTTSATEGADEVTRTTSATEGADEVTRTTSATEAADEVTQTTEEDKEPAKIEERPPTVSVLSKEEALNLLKPVCGPGRPRKGSATTQDQPSLEDLLESKFVDVGELLPPVPKKGEFDVNKIKKSLYFFS